MPQTQSPNPDIGVETIDARELASILRVSVHRIRQLSSQDPQALPPRVHLPRCRALLWRRADVEAWLAERVGYPASSPRGPGRPSKRETVEGRS